MGVSEDEVIEEIAVIEDFKKAKEIYNRIIKEIGHDGNIPPILFALCLIYIRLLNLNLD